MMATATRVVLVNDQTYWREGSHLSTLGWQPWQRRGGAGVVSYKGASWKHSLTHSWRIFCRVSEGPQLREERGSHVLLFGGRARHAVGVSVQHETCRVVHGRPHARRGDPLVEILIILVEFLSESSERSFRQRFILAQLDVADDAASLACSQARKVSLEKAPSPPLPLPSQFKFCLARGKTKRSGLHSDCMACRSTNVCRGQPRP